MAGRRRQTPADRLPLSVCYAPEASSCSFLLTPDFRNGTQWDTLPYIYLEATYVPPDNLAAQGKQYLCAELAFESCSSKTKYYIPSSSSTLTQVSFVNTTQGAGAACACGTYQCIFGALGMRVWSCT